MLLHASAIPAQTPTPVAGGGCLYFDGSNDYVTVPHSSSLNLQTGITLMLWVKPASLPSYTYRIVGKHENFIGYSMSLSPNGKFSFGIEDGTPGVMVYSPPISETNAWYHLAGTFDGTTAKYYLNGALTDSAQFTGPIGSTLSRFALGNYDGSLPAGCYYHGWIGDVSIYEVALTADQIQNTYCSQEYPATGLISRWQFDEGSGTALNDSAGSNDGVRVGPAWSIDPYPPSPCLNPTSPCFTDLVAYWKAEGDATDSAGDHDGTLVGGTTYAAGKVGQSFGCQSGDYVDVPSDPDFNVATGSYSMCAWIKTVYTPGAKCIFGRSALGWEGVDYAQYHTEVNGRCFRVQVRDDTDGIGQYVSGTSNVADDRWHFVVGVVDRSTRQIKAYVDGALDRSAALAETGALTFGEVDLTIGGLRNPNFQFTFSGSIDEMAFYKRALSASEILELYQSAYHYCEATPPPGLPTPIPPTPNMVPRTPTPVPPTPIPQTTTPGFIPVKTATPTPASAPSPIDCTYSMGFWKNHPGDWPVKEIILGAVTYVQSEVLAIFDTPPAGDASLILASQLAAAKLNVARGAEPADIQTTLATADSWLTEHPLGSNPSEPYRSEGIALAGVLCAYNEGGIGPGHCPDEGQIPPILESGDYDGDGQPDIGVFRSATGLWAVLGCTRVFFGRAGDIPVSGDYDGDQTTDIAVFRPFSSLWSVRGVGSWYLGSVEDIPIPGDYDGDGSCEAAVYRTRTGLWAGRGRMGRIIFGTAGDIPAPSDYDGNGRTDLAVFRPADGIWAVRGLSRGHLGAGSDIPVPGRYSGDQQAEIAIFRPANGLWAVAGHSSFRFGKAGDVPIPSDYNGDLLDDQAVFRRGNGFWSIRGVSNVYFGSPGDIPVTR